MAAASADEQKLEEAFLGTVELAESCWTITVQLEDQPTQFNGRRNHSDIRTEIPESQKEYRSLQANQDPKWAYRTEVTTEGTVPGNTKKQEQTIQRMFFEG